MSQLDEALGADNPYEMNEFNPPKPRGGWHYTQMKDWIAVCPDISATGARLYWIIRSIMHEKGDKKRRLSIDQLCYLLPGINGKPTSETRVKDALRELEEIGLLSNPDGDVVRRWVTDPVTGQQRKENFRRWQIEDYPSNGEDYEGWRSALAKLDAYPGPDWREQMKEKLNAQVSTEGRKTVKTGRKSAPQTRIKPATSGNSIEAQVSTEGRKTVKTGRKSAEPGRKSGGIEAATSGNEALNKVFQVEREKEEPFQGSSFDRSKEAAPPGGAGPDAAAQGQEDRVRQLVRRFPWHARDCSPKVPEVDAIVRAILTAMSKYDLTMEQVQQHGLAALKRSQEDKHPPSYVARAFSDRHVRAIFLEPLVGAEDTLPLPDDPEPPPAGDSGASPDSASTPPRAESNSWPEWCGECDRPEYRFVLDIKRDVDRPCPRCHPSIMKGAVNDRHAA